VQHRLQQPIIDQHGQTYEVTPSRLQRWRADHPAGSVEHQKTESDGIISVRVILRYQIDGQPVEVDGIAEGPRIQGEDKAVENVATKAIGRALKAAGYPGDIYACPETADMAPQAPIVVDDPTERNGKTSGDPWSVVVHFARSKGKTLQEVYDNDRSSFKWLQSWDPGKGGFKVTEKDRQLRAALDAIAGQKVTA
tara:strand:+ start:1371 stop:1955 length:585 start_codon:yes stop_codon:yes gene_type:complete